MAALTSTIRKLGKGNVRRPRKRRRVRSVLEPQPRLRWYA